MDRVEICDSIMTKISLKTTCESCRTCDVTQMYCPTVLGGRITQTVNREVHSLGTVRENLLSVFRFLLASGFHVHTCLSSSSVLSPRGLTPSVQTAMIRVHLESLLRSSQISYCGHTGAFQGGSHPNSECS